MVSVKKAKKILRTKYKIGVREENMPSKTLHGKCFRSLRRIVINSSRPAKLKKIVMAHEGGHVLAYYSRGKRTGEDVAWQKGRPIAEDFGILDDYMAVYKKAKRQERTRQFYSHRAKELGQVRGW